MLFQSEVFGSFLKHVGNFQLHGFINDFFMDDLIIQTGRFKFCIL